MSIKKEIIGKKGVGKNQLLMALLGVGALWVIVQVLLGGAFVSIASFFTTPIFWITIIVFLLIWWMRKK